MARRTALATFKACALAVVLFGWCLAPASAHEPINLDNTRPTPGIRLELVEVPSDTAQPSEAPGYRLAATGLPAGVVFGVWTRPFGHGFHEVATGFHLNGAGRLAPARGDGAAGPQYLDQMVFRPEAHPRDAVAYPRGAVWEVALVSADHKITAFAKVVPRPILAQDGPCTVSLLLVSFRGERYVATGSGFAPGADVMVESRYADRVSRQQRRVSADGVLPPDVIALASIADDRTARYSVKGRHCEVTLEYVWGVPALLGR